MGQYDLIIIDSGVGGLTIAKEIDQRCLGYSIGYFADLAHIPYGEKSEQWLVDRLSAVMAELTQRWQSKLAVIACNSASTTVLPELRKRFQLPIVGVVPAIKTAGQLSKKRCIGLLATPGTVARPYTKVLIEQFAADCEVVSIGSSELVALAEGKIRGKDIAISAIRTICQDLYDQDGQLKTDAIVLGCTHFSHLLSDLRLALAADVRWIDSAVAIADRVASLLPKTTGQTRDKLFLASRPIDQALEVYLRANGYTVNEMVSQ